MACTNNIWTKVISSLTIVFCIVYIVAQILLIIFVSKSKIDILSQIDAYINTDDVKIHILFGCSVIFNTLWTITSVLLLIFLRITETQDYSLKENQKLVKVYVAWDVIGFLSFVPDVVSIIIHGLYYGGNNDTPATKGAFYLLLLASRLVVILLFHICSWIGMLIITSALQTSLMEDGTKPKGRTIPLKPPKPALKPSKVPYLEETNVDRVRDWYKHYDGQDKNVANNYSEPDVVPQFIPKTTGNTNPGFVDNNNYAPSRPPPPPPKPTHHLMPGANTNVLVNGVPSGTLRRQLPWSYIPNNRELPQRPQKMQVSPVPSNASTYTGHAPYVPPPDYEVNNSRRTQRQEFNQPGWNQYL